MKKKLWKIRPQEKIQKKTKDNSNSLKRGNPHIHFLFLIILANFIILTTSTIAQNDQIIQFNARDDSFKKFSSNNIALQEDAESMRLSLQYTAMLLIPALLLLLGSLFWSYSLRSQVDLRTRELKKEIAHRVRVQERLIRSQKVRDRFLSSATHELRTPLASIKAYIDIIFLEEPGSMSDSVKSSLDVVKRNADRLASLTDDILDVRRMEADRLQLNLESLNFNEVIDHCISEARPFIEEKKQDFRTRIPKRPLMVEGDRIRLTQVMTNLLGNAIKFTPENGNITLQIEEKERYFQFQLANSGIGIRKEDLTRIFEPFAPIKKPTYVKGTGLGLSITKGLVEAHGGKIWADSPGEGKGATLTFTLPKLRSSKSKKQR